MNNFKRYAKIFSMVTPEAVQQARDEDFTKRQALWDACVVEDKCKKD